MSRALIARAPTRIDFGGGWTDVPPYSRDLGGAVCNIAIARYATVTASRGAPDGADRGIASASAADRALVDAALRRAGRTDAHATVASDFPLGAGLGGSSAAGVALAGALAALAGETLGPAALAERSRATEVEELGIAGGFQDHYAAAHGGALLLTFRSGVDVERLDLAPTFRDALTARALLVYTGESRLSGDTISAVLDGYQADAGPVCAALARMKALALEMAAAIRAGDLDALGELVGEHWAHQRALAHGISTPRIEALLSAGRRAGMLGGKALGASGGGCVLLVAAAGREDELAAAVAPLGTRLAYTVDERGFEIVAAISDDQETS